MATVGRIDITVPDQVLAENDLKRQRLARTRQRQAVDRIPVVANNGFFMPLQARGVSFDQFVASPLDNLRHQLLNHKWQLENIRDDTPITTDAVSVSPELGCVRDVEFPLRWQWPTGQPPKCVHLLTEPEQIDALEVPHPVSGLNARRVEWYQELRSLADRFDVRLNGQRMAIHVKLSHPGGPIPSAFALAGENLLVWMLTGPELDKLRLFGERAWLYIVAFCKDERPRLRIIQNPAATLNVEAPHRQVVFVVRESDWSGHGEEVHIFDSGDSP